jgi:signal transduction histidine kinase
MFRLLRFYSVASLVAILATAVLLTWFYRQAAIQGIIQLAEASNLTLTRAALSPIKPELLAFLKSTEHLQPNAASYPPLPPEVIHTVATLMQDRSIARIKLYNRRGVVVFSTRPHQIGTDTSRNKGFLTALSGGVGASLIYRDTFNSFDGVTEEDNLMQTYIPVRASPGEPVHGVFELYADVNRLVHQTERTEFIVMIGAVLILSALYAALVLIVHRAGRVIEQQQRTIRERTETLEILSAQMLRSEESNKKKIAIDLHEGLAQTLAAIKLKVESGRCRQSSDDVADEPADSIIPVLQEAIEEVRIIATDLHPPSLDELGLLPTLNWFCREFERQHPGISIEKQIRLQEHDVPPRLKDVLYRIVASVLDDMAGHTSAGWLHLGLWRDNDSLVLIIDDTPSEALDTTVTPLTMIDPKSRAGFARMEELTTLSGGEFQASYHSGGGTTLRAAWKHS